MQRRNLILFGDPGSNVWISKVLPQLPVQWTRHIVQLGAEKHSEALSRACESQNSCPPRKDGRQERIMQQVRLVSSEFS